MVSTPLANHFVFLKLPFGDHITAATVNAPSTIVEIVARCVLSHLAKNMRLSVRVPLPNRFPTRLISWEIWFCNQARAIVKRFQNWYSRIIFNALNRSQPRFELLITKIVKLRSVPKSEVCR